MISYTLSEALSLYDVFFKSKNTKLRQEPETFVDPFEIIKEIMYYGVMYYDYSDGRPFSDRISTYRDKARKILFEMSLEEVVPLINEPEPYISFIEPEIVEIVMGKYPVYCCQKCGELIGILGRFLFPWFHKCKKEARRK